MTHFPRVTYKNQQLHLEDVALEDVSSAFGTPVYVYSKNALLDEWNQLNTAFQSIPHLFCYAVKANSNLALLKLLASQGAGFDIVSLGELERVLLAGGEPKKIIFSGVAKREDELRKAIFYSIASINVESEGELNRIQALAKEMDCKVGVSLRVNPDVDAQTHPYISTGLKENKFGIPSADAIALYRRIAVDEHLEAVGIDCHIGSQLTELSPFEDAAKQVFGLVREIEQQGIRLQHIDLGGGLGIRYQDEQPPSYSEYANCLLPFFSGTQYTLLLEPGRSLVGNAGVLLTRVEGLKQNHSKNFVLVDAAMNDLLRPALYQAWHEILPVQQSGSHGTLVCDVVGPVCESGDFLAQDRNMPTPKLGDVLAVMSAGAYAMSMASSYNSRQRPAEVLVDGEDASLIRKRDALDQLWENEIMLEDPHVI